MVKYYKTEAMFGALGQDVRRRMVERLAQKGELSISDMASPFRISLPAALKHSQILEKSGIIRRKKRGREQYCSLNEEAFAAMFDWMVTYRNMWNSRFDRLGRILAKRKSVTYKNKK